jgi:hypothetical protein
MQVGCDAKVDSFESYQEQKQLFQRVLICVSVVSNKRDFANECRQEKMRIHQG